MKPKGKTDRVIVSAEEAQRERVAQNLAAQGPAAFGDPNERFDLGSDMDAMNQVGMSLTEPDPAELAARREMELDAIATAGFGGGNPAAESTATTSAWGGGTSVAKKEEPVMKAEEPKQTPVEPPKEQQPQQEQEAPAQPQLSDDPIKRMHQISDLFRSVHPNFPTGDQLIQWKNLMGEIFVLDLDDKVFIYRYLKRQEWVQMNANEAYHNMRQDQKEDMIYNKCVVWPKLGPEQVAMLPAGCVSSIVGQIEQQSMFLDPRQLANVTIKL